MPTRLSWRSSPEAAPNLTAHTHSLVLVRLLILDAPTLVFFYHIMATVSHQNGSNPSKSSSLSVHATIAPPDKPVSSRQAATCVLPWSIDTFAAFFALSSFSVLIVVLKHYEGNPPTTWPIGVLTLNGLVAILSTITRAALTALVSNSLSQSKWIRLASSRRRRLRELDLYDQASWSVWGSFCYLCSTRGIHLASLAAVLTIVALAFDAFAQQVISYETHGAIVRTTSQLQLPTVPRAEIFTGTQQNSGARVVNAGLPMEAAWHAGLLTFNATDLLPACPTGNCTWPVVSSLAVCGECTDVSSDLDYTEDLTQSPYWAFNFTLPDGTQLVNNQSPVTTYRLIADAANTSYPGLRYKSIEQDPAGYLMLAHFEIISQRDTTKLEHDWGLNETVAHECAMWFCIEAYNISMTNGQLNQTTIGQWSQIDPGSIPADGFDDYRFSSSLFNFSAPPSEFNIPDGTTWGVGLHTLGDLKTYVDTFFPVSITQSDASFIPSLANGIWGSIGHIDQYISNFARTMTHAIRISSLVSPLGELHYQGTAYKNETSTQVRWAWLAFPAAFPAAMLVGSCLLLLVTVWRTERSPVGAWKDSSLVLLFLRVGEGLQEAARGQITHETETLGSQVGKERVKLSSVDGEWWLD